MSRPLCPLVLSEEERVELAALAARRKTAQALAMRARIVLLAGERIPNREVAARLGIDQATVGKWRRRFGADRLDGLRDEVRCGAPRTVDDARVEAVIVRTLESLPEGATHWSSRGMARASGVSTSTVQRIWRAFGLQLGGPRKNATSTRVSARATLELALESHSSRWHRPSRELRIWRSFCRRQDAFEAV